MHYVCDVITDLPNACKVYQGLSWPLSPSSSPNLKAVPNVKLVWETINPCFREPHGPRYLQTTVWLWRMGAVVVRTVGWKYGCQGRHTRGQVGQLVGWLPHAWQWVWRLANFIVNTLLAQWYFKFFIYLAGCTTFLHLPAPIWQLYYLLLPFVSVIPVFFH